MDKSRLHSVEQPFWLLQMLPNAYGSWGLAQHFSNFTGTCFCRYDLENNCSLLGWPYHLRHIPWRAFRNTRRGTSTISWRKSQNKLIEMRVLQNKSPLFGTCPQRQWSTIRFRKNHCRGNVPYPYRSNRRHLFSGFLLKLPPLCWKLYRDCSITPQINQSFLQLDTLGTGSPQNLSSRPLDDSNFIFPINEGTFFCTQTQAWLQGAPFSLRFKMAKNLPVATLRGLSLKLKPDILQPSGSFWLFSVSEIVFQVESLPSLRITEHCNGCRTSRTLME